MSLTVSSVQERLSGYYTQLNSQLTTTKAGPALLAIVALYVVRKYFQRRKRIAARKLWSNPSREVAVVTGGSGGIGSEIVRQLAARGFKVAILDLASPPSPLLSNTVRFYKTNVTDYDSIVSAQKSIEKELGPVTILVNNAGTSSGPLGVVGTDPKRNKLVIEVNLLSYIYTLKLFLPHMIRTKHGHIMTVASAGSFCQPSFDVDYAASKAGTLALHETLQLELELLYQNRGGVLCSVVHPGWVLTELTRSRSKQEFCKKMLPPSAVAEKMVNQLMSGQAGSLYVPGAVGLLPWIRVLPHSWQHRIRIGAALDASNNSIGGLPRPPMP